MGRRINQRQRIVADDRDRERRLEWLRRVVEEHGWRLHAFVLMSNHEHPFVETPEANLPRGMKVLNGAYTNTSTSGTAAAATSSRGALRRTWCRSGATGRC